jgi:hypothetical protein
MTAVSEDTTTTSPSPELEDSKHAPARQPRPHFRRVEHPLVALVALGRPFSKFDLEEITHWPVAKCRTYLDLLSRRGLVERTPFGSVQAPKFLVITDKFPDLFPPTVAPAPCRALIVRPPVALQPVALTTYMQSPFAALCDLFLRRPFVCAEVISPCPF